MKFSEIAYDTVKEYLACVSDEDQPQINIYIAAAKSYIKTYTALTDEELDAVDYFVMPALMLISSFYENKSIEMSGKLSATYKNLLTLGMNHSL